MASSYSTDLKLELMATGENAGTWGDNTNNNLNLIQQAIAGYEAIALTDGGTVTLAMTDKTISNARNMVIKFTGTLTGASTVTIPDSIEKFYIFDLSAVTGVTNLTIKTVSGTGFTAGEAKIVAAYSDGTNLNEIALNTLGGTIGTAQIDDNSITAAKISNNAVTTDKILASNVTTNKLAASAVTANNIANSTITQAKLATDSVGPDQLISTGVTAGSYTVASITVDADGRITSASSGTAGGGSFETTYAYSGGATGTYTANPAANVIKVYMSGGGGGATGTSPNNPNNQVGGMGGYGYFTTSITQPFSVPYSVGNGGGSGSPGGSTSFGNFTANGGTGDSNTTGNAPGATYDGSSVRSPASFFGSGDHLVDGMPRLAGVGGASGTQCNVYQVIGQGAVSTNQPSRGGGIVVFENIGP
jgi:hypothetical protein